MQNGMSSIHMMGMLMSKNTLELNIVLELVQLLNRSYFQCQHVITILSDIFQRQKSGRILFAVEILEYLVKNTNKNFHQAANKESFQKRFLGLLKRVRGKTSFLKDMRSNTDNWNKIQAKVLYLIQLWYDAFILEESVYNHIIETYKILRKENIMFPPRSVNQKNMLYVKTQSPILQNIEDISKQDHQKFRQKLTNMGLSRMTQQMQLIEAVEQKKKLVRKIDVDQISERIAIVRSNGCQGREMLKLVEEIKKDLEFGKVDPAEEKYWKDIKEAAESVIEEWEQTNAQLIKQYEREYLQSKLGKMGVKEQIKKQQIKVQNDQLLNMPTAQISQLASPKVEVKPTMEINLLDL